MQIRYAKKMKKFSITLFLLQILSISLFLYFAFKGDQAMGKDGIGDIKLSNKFHKNAGLSFYTATAFWLVSIIANTINKTFSTKESQISIGIPPIFLVIGFILLFFVEK